MGERDGEGVVGRRQSKRSRVHRAGNREPFGDLVELPYEVVWNIRQVCGAGIG